VARRTTADAISLDLRRNGCVVALSSRGELQKAMANCPRTLCRLLAVLALVVVAGCAASGPEPSFETAYSAVGAQVK
jgi:hypothetical protein